MVADNRQNHPKKYLNGRSQSLIEYALTRAGDIKHSKAFTAKIFEVGFTPDSDYDEDVRLDNFVFQIYKRELA